MLLAAFLAFVPPNNCVEKDTAERASYPGR